MFEHVARELRAKLMRERPVGHQAGHLASRAGRRPPAQTAARPNKRHHMAPGTPMDAETQRPEHRRTSRTPAAPQQHVVSYNPWPQPTSIPIFPHQQAEKSPQNQHVLSFNPQNGRDNGATRSRRNKNRRPRRICGFIVREGGVEPPLHHWNTDLNRARLPIPPLARTQKE